MTAMRTKPPDAGAAEIKSIARQYHGIARDGQHDFSIPDVQIMHIGQNFIRPFASLGYIVSNAEQAALCCCGDNWLVAPLYL
ncbi:MULTISPECIES: hypothetical protein [unclassified Ruegeria]|uniref:hypothetical protein n=1 Tax=unclassified Ruegeria TaxID=2625375 RepID=UPI0014812243|nr:MULTISPECIES: hypothetical protein [unclassified Ruegeria]